MGLDGREGFDEFVAARSRALLRTAYLLTGDHQHAEDLLQTALVLVLERWDRLRDRGAAEAYVRRTLATTYTSWWRRRSWRERPAAELPEPVHLDTTSGADGRVDAGELWELLRALPRQQRAVVVLRFYDDRSVAETSELLGISAGTVKSHTHRALGALRVRLDGRADVDRARAPAGTSPTSPTNHASTRSPA